MFRSKLIKTQTSMNVIEMFSNLYEYAVLSNFEPVSGPVADAMREHLSILDSGEFPFVRSLIGDWDLVQTTKGLIDILDAELDHDPEDEAPVRLGAARISDIMHNTIALVTGNLDPSVIEPEEYMSDRGFSIYRIQSSIHTNEELTSFASFFKTFMFIKNIEQDGVVRGFGFRDECLYAQAIVRSGTVIVGLTGEGIDEYLDGEDQYFSSMDNAPAQQDQCHVIIDNMARLEAFAMEMQPLTQYETEKQNYSELDEDLVGSGDEDFVQDELSGEDPEALSKEVRDRDHTYQNPLKD